MKTLLPTLALVLLPAPALAQSHAFQLPLDQYEIDQKVSTDAVSDFIFNLPLKELLKNAAMPGTVTPCSGPGASPPCVPWCVSMAANSFIDTTWPAPISAQQGVVALYGSTGCSTVTATAQFGE
jgi:hypothetical protein